MLNPKIAATFLILFSTGSAAPAVGFGGGDTVSGGSVSGGDCCLFPPELSARANLLEESFEKASEEDLARQSWAGELCKNHPCGDEVTESQAKDLFLDYRQRRADWWQDAAIWIGVLISILSLFVSFLGYRQTLRNERDIGRLEARSESAGGD